MSDPAALLEAIELSAGAAFDEDLIEERLWQHWSLSGARADRPRRFRIPLITKEQPCPIP